MWVLATWYLNIKALVGALERYKHSVFTFLKSGHFYVGYQTELSASIAVVPHY